MSATRCPTCKHPLEIGEVTVACVSATDTELAFGCEHCDETFSVWVEHKNGWANSKSVPVNLTVAKGGAS